MNISEIKGKRYNQLTIIGSGEKKHFVLAQCDCGKVQSFYVYNILSGHAKSCGCLIAKVTRERATTHGKTNHPLYGVWASMIKRCYNQKCKAYKDYGGRGIVMCDEWRNDFMSFYNWAIANGYEAGLEIDRRNNDGIYEPSNCRWVTILVNANNKRRSRFLLFKGIKKTISEWAREYNIPAGHLLTRIENNWDIQDALTFPVKKRGGYNKYIRSVRHVFGFIQ